MPQVTIGGHRLNYEEVGSGPALVFIAGTRFDSAKAWAPFMEEHATGFRVILPDPRGMAGSAHTTDVSPEDWVSDLAGLLDALSLPKVELVAETFGTRIAARFAADHPDRVTHLILNGAIAYSYPDADSSRSDPANMTPERRESMQRHHGDDWQAVNQFYVGMHARQEFHDYFDLRKVAERITAPTLLMRGDVDDSLHPVAHSAELHRLIPRSWLSIYPNTEFNAMRAHPKEVWDLIRTFIAEQTQP